MLQFLYADKEHTKLVSVEPLAGTEARLTARRAGLLLNRNDWKSIDDAARVAAQATQLTGNLHIATDEGSHVSPRYGVIKMYKPGMAVSKGFNGDSYPCGHITSISKSLRVIVATTESGATTTFYRVRQTGSWRSDQTWFLGEGHRYEQNPSF